MSSLFNPDYLFSLASKYSLRPSKKYGQNYLIDENVINKIIEISDLNKNDTVVEVGPGFGVLTSSLVEEADRVIAFEIEKKLQPYWEAYFNCLLEQSARSLSGHGEPEISRCVRNDKSEIQIVWGNILREFPLLNKNIHKYIVVANLPYQITSAVIRMFLEAEPAPEKMVLMVQKEVGERICAKPGDMSLLSVAVQYFAEVKYEFTVQKLAFWPSPEVDSSVISVKSSKNFNKDKDFEKKFFQIVRIGFANRRKLLIKNLEPLVKKDRERLRIIFSELNILPTARAQELSVEKWKELARKIN